MKKPRLTSVQKFRNNIPSESVEEYYRRAIMIPFLDHVIASLKEKFINDNTIISNMNKLLAQNIFNFY